MAFSSEDIREFCLEAQELLELGEKSLLAVDKGGDFQANYDALFRAFHSIKGGAGMMELTTLQAHMHELENLLTQCKETKKIEKPFIDFFLRGIDAAREIMEGKSVAFDYRVHSAAPVRTSNQSVGTPSSVAPPASVPVKTAPASAKVIPFPKEKSDEFIGTAFVIDDEPEITQIFSEHLGDAGLDVCSFTNPLLALEAIRKSPPDVVVTDFHMPDLDGLALTREVQKIQPELPVIIISGRITGQVILSGVYAILEKPISGNALRDTALAAAQKGQAARLLNRSIDLLMYQFSDLDDFLKASGREEVRKTLTREIKTIIELRNHLRTLNKRDAA